jgi:Skp family chaperone for outer membrane proteins
MRNLRYVLALGACATLVAPAATAYAQSNPQSNGAVICVFSKNEALANSAVGKYAHDKLSQVQMQFTKLMQSKEDALRANYLAANQTGDDSARQQRVDELEAQLRDIDETIKQFDGVVQVAQERADQRITNVMNPLVHQAFAQRHCSVLLDQSQVYDGDMNANLDITPDVIRLMDATITQIPVDQIPFDRFKVSP